MGAGEQERGRPLNTSDNRHRPAGHPRNLRTTQRVLPMRRVRLKPCRSNIATVPLCRNEAELPPLDGDWRPCPHRLNALRFGLVDCSSRFVPGVAGGDAFHVPTPGDRWTRSGCAVTRELAVGAGRLDQPVRRDVVEAGLRAVRVPDHQGAHPRRVPQPEQQAGVLR
jgi:hypothetical protein